MYFEISYLLEKNLIFWYWGFWKINFIDPSILIISYIGNLKRAWKANFLFKLSSCMLNDELYRSSTFQTTSGDITAALWICKKCSCAIFLQVTWGKERERWGDIGGRAEQRGREGYRSMLINSFHQLFPEKLVSRQRRYKYKM